MKGVPYRGGQRNRNPPGGSGASFDRRQPGSQKRIGVGLVNVNNRLQILFGKEYGLRVESEPDEGTRVIICIPAIPYNEENRRLLENGRLP